MAIQYPKLFKAIVLLGTGYQGKLAIKLGQTMAKSEGKKYGMTKGTAKIDGLTFVKNDAAFYLFPKLDVKKFNITNDKVFARDLLHATNILLVPGSGFDWAQPDHFRIVMLPEAEVLADAMKRMGTFLDGYKQK